MIDNREIVTRSEVQCNKNLQECGIKFEIRQTESGKTRRRLSAKAWRNGSQTISRGWRTKSFYLRLNKRQGMLHSGGTWGEISLVAT